MSIKIEKGIPFLSINSKYPFAEMEVGDSFFVQGGSVRTIAPSLHRVGKQLGVKFSARKRDGGVRVWRLA